MVFGDRTQSENELNSTPIQTPKHTVIRYIFPAFLLMLYCWLSVSAAHKHSHVFDEIIHITGGYSYWAVKDYRFNPESGIFPQRFMTLPLLFQDIQLPSINQPAWWHSDLWNFSHQFFYETGNNIHQILFSARLMICVLGVILGAFVFFWSYRLFGRAGGILSLILFAFCPSMLAHGSLATNDLSLTLFLTASTLCIWRLLHKVTALSLVVTSAVLAGLFLSKASSLLIFPIAGILLVVRLLSPRPLQIQTTKKVILISQPAWKVGVWITILISISITVMVIIWAFYGFRFSIFADSTPGRDHLMSGFNWESLVPITGNMGRTVNQLRKQKILPEPYLYGLLVQRQAIRLRRSFLNGRYSISGFHDFFFYCFLYKTPLSLFGILLLAIYGTIKWNQFRPGEKWYEGERSLVPLIVLPATYLIFALSATLNIGHRHILPIYPSLFILSGAAAVWLQQSSRLFKSVLVLLISIFVVESLLIRPHYLSFFNTLAGGPRNAHRHLVDSSLDWGQDLPALNEWLRQNAPGGRNIYLSYFGSADPVSYGVRAKRLASFPDIQETREKWIKMEGGIYCISATMLQSVYNNAIGPWNVVYEQEYQQILKAVEQGQRLERPGMLNHFQLARLCAYLRQREPDGFAGYSILIYDLTTQEVERALYGPPAELYPRIMVSGIQRNE